MPPFYKSNCEARPIHHLLALTMNCNDDSKPIYSVQYNPVHLKGKQTMIYFRTPETVYLLQTSFTNHNYPFYSPPNTDFSISKIGIYKFDFISSCIFLLNLKKTLSYAKSIISFKTSSGKSSRNIVFQYGCWTGGQ